MSLYLSPVFGERASMSTGSSSSFFRLNRNMPRLPVPMDWAWTSSPSVDRSFGTESRSRKSRLRLGSW